MGVVIQLHRTTQGQAHGAGITTAYMAQRHGLSADAARQLGEEAKDLVAEKGYSAAWARSEMLKKVRSLAAQPVFA